MHPIQKLVLRRFIAIMLGLSALLARRPALRRLSFAWSHALAGIAIRRKGIRPASDLGDLARAWQSGFPSSKQVPVERISADTVYARIETPCPLRGSGATAACWRMMEYDRAVARAAGGQFLVLQSQAEPDVTACRVALRRAQSQVDDLVPAHIRAPETP
ncbi:MAG: hypothetical protein ACK4FK_02105 [Ferrovibrio sp.]|jgi:hypothetical protein|uniref:hypothetical protein n=1 Tax=Ferrovibrio sp. TaxID=1917215 RepID=UPI00391B3241